MQQSRHNTEFPKPNANNAGTTRAPGTKRTQQLLMVSNAAAQSWILQPSQNYSGVLNSLFVDVKTKTKLQINIFYALFAVYIVNGFLSSVRAVVFDVSKKRKDYIKGVFMCTFWKNATKQTKNHHLISNNLHPLLKWWCSSHAFPHLIVPTWPTMFSNTCHWTFPHTILSYSAH